MADKEMYDYLSTITADYTSTSLNMTSIRPQDVVTEESQWNQEIRMGSDGSVEVVDLTSGPICFYCNVKFNHKSSSDIGTVYDFYHDTAKANARANTFQWIHPTDGHTYVARFWSKIPRTLGRPSYQALPSITLRVEGRIAD